MLLFGCVRDTWIDTGHRALQMNRAYFELEDFVRDCRDNWDCDADAHRHGHSSQCRKCEAENLLKKHPPEGEKKADREFVYFVVFALQSQEGGGFGNEPVILSMGGRERTTFKMVDEFSETVIEGRQ